MDGPPGTLLTGACALLAGCIGLGTLAGLMRTSASVMRGRERRFTWAAAATEAGSCMCATNYSERGAGAGTINCLTCRWRYGANRGLVLARDSVLSPFC